MRTLDDRRHNLPMQPSAFVGREAELAQIVQQLAADSIRLITLTGPGGTGKTRLALRAAADQLERMRDGVFFIDLATVTDTESALAVIARVLGLTQTSKRTMLEELKSKLRDQDVLLVLDNFEQVTVAAGSIAELLQESPSLKLLVTSREPLHIRGEHVFPVPPLSLPPAVLTDRSAEEFGRFEAILLFVDRARAVRPDFHLTDDNVAAVVEICRRLDGLPLAIELATARINLLPVDAIRDRLSSRLKAVGAGGRDLPARQRTLSATIDWSYQLLEAGEQRLFELLSIFAGIAIEAVEQVATEVLVPGEGGLEPLETLGSLVDKSLVRASGSGNGEGQLLMLETIREYAAERLAERPEMAEAGRRAHATYFTSFAQRKLTEVTGAGGESALFALTREVENLRAAWRYWLDVRDVEQLDRLVECLSLVYQAEGRYEATVKLMTELLDILSMTPSSAERVLREVTVRTSHARALTALKGYTAEVEEAYARALALFEGQRDRPQIFPVLRDLARFYVGTADFERAAHVGEEILRLADSQDDAGMRVDGHLLVGTGLMTAGDLRGALEQLDRAIQSFESPRYRARRFRVGTDPRVSSLTTSAFVLWLLGSPDQAVVRADRAVALGATLDPYSHAYGLFHSGFLHLWRSEPQLVRERALQLLRLVVDRDFPVWRALGTCLAGAANTLLGETADGLVQIFEGVNQYRGTRSPPAFWPFLRFVQAVTLAGAGRPSEAMAVLDEILETSADPSAVALFHLFRGDLLLAVGKSSTSAEAAYRGSLARARSLGAVMVELQAQSRLCRLRRDRGDVDDGAELRLVYDRFTEGFATRDLIAARELLEARS